MPPRMPLFPNTPTPFGRAMTARGIDRAGVTPRIGNGKPASIFPEGSLRGAEKPLPLQFPGAKYVQVSGRKITAGAATIGAGSAWFGLGTWDVNTDLGQPHWACGARVELGACNITPVTDPGGLGLGSAWGSTFGTKAAIVIGAGLTWVQEATWTQGPGAIPFVEDTAVGGNVLVKTYPNEYAVFHFPKGKQEDAPSPSVYRTGQTTPLAIVLTPGTSLSVALVVNRAQYNTCVGAGAANFFTGSFFVEVLLAPYLNPRDIVQP